MEEKDFKKLLTEHTEEIKRHSTMLLEEFQSQLKVIFEYLNFSIFLLLVVLFQAVYF